MDVNTQINITINGEMAQHDFGLTVSQLLEKLDLKRKGIAVELNQRIIPRNEFETCRITEGDSLEVVTLVGGG